MSTRILGVETVTDANAKVIPLMPETESETEEMA